MGARLLYLIVPLLAAAALAADLPYMSGDATKPQGFRALPWSAVSGAPTPVALPSPCPSGQAYQSLNPVNCIAFSGSGVPLVYFGSTLVNFNSEGLYYTGS